MLRRNFVRLCTLSKDQVDAAIGSARTECFLEVSSHVATMTLNRPSRKNALGKTLLRELRENLDYCRGNSTTVRCLVLQSAVDGVFCAGADLRERKDMTPAEARLFVSTLRTVFCEVEDLDCPTIAAIEGAALGGGLELALGADIRVAGAAARLGVPETSLAIIPGAGGTQRLTKAVGLSRAKLLTFTAKPVLAAEAEKISLITQCVEKGKAYECSVAIAQQIVANGPIAVAAAKVAINEGYGLDRSKGMLLEKLCYDKVLQSKDRLEGLAAFTEKRKPHYKGE